MCTSETVCLSVFTESGAQAAYRQMKADTDRIQLRNVPVATHYTNVVSLDGSTLLCLRNTSTGKGPQMETVVHSGVLGRERDGGGFSHSPELDREREREVCRCGPNALSLSWQTPVRHAVRVGGYVYVCTDEEAAPHTHMHRLDMGTWQWTSEPLYSVGDRGVKRCDRPSGRVVAMVSMDDTLILLSDGDEKARYTRQGYPIPGYTSTTTPTREMWTVNPDSGEYIRCTPDPPSWTDAPRWRGVVGDTLYLAMRVGSDRALWKYTHTGGWDRVCALEVYQERSRLIQVCGSVLLLQRDRVLWALDTVSMLGALVCILTHNPAEMWTTAAYTALGETESVLANDERREDGRACAPSVCVLDVDPSLCNGSSSSLPGSPTLHWESLTDARGIPSAVVQCQMEDRRQMDADRWRGR
ncbi:hypothetical protein KIPB_000816 [Kipferlia bialata]|uniref:Uncharacterized protein n=1 Tax=Kipferlia bialata TaxID=797122 RepID=A0A391NIC3_9EUKA|nr:hypothetical protein KIPB_000816 [Kipferlia bialata]|eukprot:g816.t1